MKKLLFVFTGCMVISLITYSKSASYKPWPLLAPSKGFYSIGAAGNPAVKGLMLESIPAGKDFFHASLKGYYGIAGNGEKMNKSIFQLPAGSKKAVIQKGYYSQVY